MRTSNTLERRMKTSTLEIWIAVVPRLSALWVALAGLLPLAGAGCDQGNEGERCNPLATNDECTGGLVCSGNPIGLAASHPIAYCPENYCCTPSPASSDNPYCQPGCNGGAQAECTDSLLGMGAPNPAACAFADGGAAAVAALAEGGAAPETSTADASSEGSPEGGGGG